MYTALNGINVAATDIKNTYLQAPSSKKHFIICGEEFWLEHVGEIAIITQALYGGKSAGSDFWKHLRACIDHLGFTATCKVDPDLWIREAQRDYG